MTSAVHSYTDMYSRQADVSFCGIKQHLKSLTCKQLLSVSNNNFEFSYNVKFYWLYSCPVIFSFFLSFLSFFLSFFLLSFFLSFFRFLLPCFLLLFNKLFMIIIYFFFYLFLLFFSLSLFLLLFIFCKVLIMWKCLNKIFRLIAEVTVIMYW